MARKHEAVGLLHEGNPPSAIAKRMGVSVSTVMGYLYNQVGEGRIHRSDIVFSIDQNTRDLIERAICELNTTENEVLVSHLPSGYIDRDDLRVYLELRDARVALGDMYELIREIEVTLHRVIKDVLSETFGPDWWRKGVPEGIRAECAASRERDADPAEEPYCYTTLIHLKDILDKRWSVFSKVLPPKVSTNRNELLSRLTELNRIRNSVMHPVKASPPTEVDFGFVRDLSSYLRLKEWPCSA